MNAVQILDKYIYMMAGKPHSVGVNIDPSAFNVPDTALDDAYKVRVYGGKGEICASNKRAALIAAYHLLRSCGCGFTRPGASGEVIPSGLTLNEITAEIDVFNANRFRGICIEGAVSLDIALDMLEWMPKVGLNTYFMQFREGYTFFDRYYSEAKNKTRMPLDFNLTISRDIAGRIVSKARELGLMYHGVGHGFHVECFGINGLGWEQVPGVWPEEYEYAMALISGESVGGGQKRAMHWDMPMITALCYENESVQNIFVEKAAEYIASHDEYDYVHVWLDDCSDNKCECDLCKDVQIADSYVKILNKLDAKLTELDCATKIVFLGYCETLWPPEKEILANPGRFTFMFAPITRDCLSPLWSSDETGEIQPYSLNKQPFPKTNGQLLAHLDAWNDYRKKIGMDMTDSFDFDYYNDRFKDPGQFVMAKVIYGDVIHLRERCLNGVVNCQSQRVFADAALPMYVYAAALLQPERNFDDIANAFFKEAFSPANGPTFRQYFENLTAASGCLRSETGEFTELEAILSEVLPEYQCDNIGAAESIRLLKFTLDLYRREINVIKAKKSGGEAVLQSALDAAKNFAAAHTVQFETAFDYYTFEGVLEKLSK